MLGSLLVGMTAVVACGKADGVVLSVDSRVTSSTGVITTADKIVPVGNSVFVTTLGHGNVVTREAGKVTFDYHFQPWMEDLAKTLPRNPTASSVANAIMTRAATFFHGRGESLRPIPPNGVRQTQFIIVGLDGHQPRIIRVLMEPNGKDVLLEKIDNYPPKDPNQALVITTAGIVGAVDSFDSPLWQSVAVHDPSIQGDHEWTLSVLAQVSGFLITLDGPNRTDVGPPIRQVIVHSDGHVERQIWDARRPAGTGQLKPNPRSN